MKASEEEEIELVVDEDQEDEGVPAIKRGGKMAAG